MTPAQPDPSVIAELNKPGLRGSAAERFWRNVERADSEACWQWTGTKSSRGYGRMTTFKSSSTPAHHVAIWLDGRAIPAGMVVDHLCRNRMCVNPAHLRVVSPKVNSLENSAGPTAKNAAKTHCVNGHPFDEQNTIAWRGTRRCRACQSKMAANRQARIRAAHLMEQKS